jgi:hypothetical protein
LDHGEQFDYNAPEFLSVDALTAVIVVGDHEDIYDPFKLPVSGFGSDFQLQKAGHVQSLSGAKRLRNAFDGLLDSLRRVDSKNWATLKQGQINLILLLGAFPFSLLEPLLQGENASRFFGFFGLWLFLRPFYLKFNSIHFKLRGFWVRVIVLQRSFSHNPSQVVFDLRR